MDPYQNVLPVKRARSDDVSTGVGSLELDYGEVHINHLRGEFNAFFYLFKCVDPINTNKSMFIKRSEIPALLDIAYSNKLCLLYNRSSPGDRFKLTTYAVYVAMENEVKMLKSFVFDDEQKKQEVATNTLRMLRMYGHSLWQEKDLSNYVLPWNTIEQLNQILFYMGVKYLYNKRTVYNTLKNSEWLFTEILETVRSKDKNHSQENLDASISKIDNEIISLTKKRGILLKTKQYHEFVAKTAEQKGKYPEDKEIVQEAKKQYN